MGKEAAAILGFVAGLGGGLARNKKEKKQEAREDERFQMQKDQFELYKENAALQAQLTQNNLEVAKFNLAKTKALGTPEEQAAAEQELKQLDLEMKQNEAWMADFKRINAPEDRQMLIQQYEDERAYKQQQLAISRGHLDVAQQNASKNDSLVDLSRRQSQLLNGLQRIEANMLIDPSTGQKSFRSQQDKNDWDAINSQLRILEGFQGQSGGAAVTQPAARIPAGQTLGGLPMSGASQNGTSDLTFQPGKTDNANKEKMAAVEAQIQSLESIRDTYEIDSPEYKHYNGEVRKAWGVLNDLNEAMGGVGTIPFQQPTADTGKAKGKSSVYEVASKVSMVPTLGKQGGVMDFLSDPFRIKQTKQAFMQEGVYSIPSDIMTKVKNAKLKGGDNDDISKFYPDDQRIRDFYEVVQAVETSTGEPDYKKALDLFIGDGMAFSNSLAADRAWIAASSGVAERDPLGETVMTLGATGLLNPGGAAQMVKGMGQSLRGGLRSNAPEYAPGLSPEISAGIRGAKADPSGLSFGTSPKTPFQPTNIPARSLRGQIQGAEAATPNVPNVTNIFGGRGGMGQIPQPVQVPPTNIPARSMHGGNLGVGQVPPQTPQPVPSFTNIPARQLSGGQLGVGQQLPQPPYSPLSQSGMFNPALPNIQFGNISPEVLRALGLIR